MLPLRQSSRCHDVERICHSGGRRAGRHHQKHGRFQVPARHAGLHVRSERWSLAWKRKLAESSQHSCEWWASAIQPLISSPLFPRMQIDTHIKQSPDTPQTDVTGLKGSVFWWCGSYADLYIFSSAGVKELSIYKLCVASQWVVSLLICYFQTVQV